ncbi:hypothetical protein BT69DRAFT_1327653 [Atractiella rhizophila]|nr:hypothetical protein BT69DRAFT_1327653 [Atractiella rhizophila]
MASSIKTLRYNLANAFKKGDPKTGELIANLKLQLATAGSLDGNGENKEAARDVLEISAFYSLRSRSITLFSRALSQLSPFYSASFSELAPSASQGPLISLSLLLLLSQNRISQFHTTLETLPSEMMENKYIRWVVDLEQQLGAGAFAKAYQQAKTGLPTCSPGESGYANANDFAWLSAQLIEGMRTEIASCASRAYASKTLSLNSASTLLFFSAKEKGEAMEFSRRNDWEIDPSTGLIAFAGDGEEERDREEEKDKVGIHALEYAKELESII